MALVKPLNFGLWSALPRPFFVLAPMAGVTDASFRRVIAKHGKPDVTWTEFTSADGLCSVGRRRMIHDLWYTEAERPIVAQLYGGKPENFRGAARLCAELGFDGIDINMGCPARDVEKHCAGAYLIRDAKLAQEVIGATKDGASGLPVSVKTRIGYRDNTLDEWLTALVEANPAAITIHARTRDEASKVPARWDVVADAMRLIWELRPDEATRPLVIGNGDVKDLAGADWRAAETGCDGIMLGRAIFGNPWLFNRDLRREDVPLEQVFDAMLEHTSLYIELLGGIKPLELMKKHFKAYVTGFRGASDLRQRLMDARDYAEIKAIIAEARASLALQEAPAAD
jgi:nifR3 family TIM-barrel protein